MTGSRKAMKATEQRRLLNKPRKDLVEIIDELQASLARWKGDPVQEPPFYWGIAFLGWGSFEDNVDFIDGGEACPTPQAAVDAWEDQRHQQMTKAEDQDSLDPMQAQLLVYRIDEVGRAMTDRRWVFKAKS